MTATPRDRTRMPARAPRSIERLDDRRLRTRRLFAPLRYDLFRGAEIADVSTSRSCPPLHVSVRQQHGVHRHVGCDLLGQPCTDPEGAVVANDGSRAVSARTRCE